MAIEEASGRTLARIGWGFVALGIGLRVARVAIDFPLWWDEAFVGVNLLRRGYFDLLKPLDYGQVCPLLFLWAERATVGILGFSEWSLRLFPLMCGVATVVIFHRVAAKALTPIAAVLATAIFAASFHPIRHAADAKPYASDLLAALVLLSLAVEWWSTRRTAWLWGLAAVAPIAVALSHPAIFIAAGIGLGLAVSVWKTGRCGDRLALLSFQAAAAGTFLGLFVLFTSAQARATLPAMSADWAASFPPLRNPIALPFWLLDTHAGNMLAYPCGGPNGASGATLILLIVGSITLIRRGNGTIAACCLAPFGVALVAAAMGRYPYGGSACGGSTRFMQYLAPAICLLSGAGASAILDRIRSPRRLRILAFGLIALAFVGVVPVASDLSHPYRAIHAERSRAFARRFWPEVSRGAEVACLSWDLGVGAWNSIHLGLPVALCNQAICSPNRRLGRGPDWSAISADHPLRCVLSDAPSEDGIAIKSWLESMKTRFELANRETIVVDVGAAGSKTRPERYDVFEFVPRSSLIRSGVERPSPLRYNRRFPPRIAALDTPRRDLMGR